MKETAICGTLLSSRSCRSRVLLRRRFLKVHHAKVYGAASPRQCLAPIGTKPDTRDRDVKTAMRDHVAIVDFITDSDVSDGEHGAIVTPVKLQMAGRTSVSTCRHDPPFGNLMNRIT